MDMAEALLESSVVRIRDFVEPERCTRILREAKASAISKVGTILDKDAPSPVVIVDFATRRARHVKISSETKAFLRGRMESLIPMMAARFGRALSAAQDPQLIAYRPGDFFVYHYDTRGAANEPPHVRARKVALVLFLNDEGDMTPVNGEVPGYEGGALQFYAHDLVPRPEYEGSAVSIHGQAGLLVAFEPEKRHQVQKVREGERFTVVCWLE